MKDAEQDGFAGFAGFILLVGLFLVAAIYTMIQDGNNKAIQQNEVLQNASKLELHKFHLKEMNTKDLINGKVSGSFLLIGGSIYGSIDTNQYLNVVYFDDENITDPTKDKDVYRITKFNYENLEIVTIPKNETPYFRYVNNGYQFCDWNEVCNFKIKLGTPRLFLPDGWAILNEGR